MVKQFLKIAGVRSEKEFYKKYPTKESFFKAHPDAEMLDMAMYGGGVYKHAGSLPHYQGLSGTSQVLPDKPIPKSKIDQYRDRAMLNQMELNADLEADRTAREIKKAYDRELAYRQKKNMLDNFYENLPYRFDPATKNVSPDQFYNKMPSTPYKGDRSKLYELLKGYYQMGGGMEQQAAAQGGGDQQEQVIQFIAQALQQGADPQEIMQQLVQAGIPEEQAGQLIEAVAQQLQQMMAQSQGGMEQEQMAQQQGMMRMGGAPCYKCGGKMKKGGQAYSGTYSAGNYYQAGGTYVPTYADMAYNPDATMYADGGSFDNPGFRALPPQVQAKIMGASKKMVGGDLQVGGEYEMSQAEIDDLIKKGYKVKYVK